MRMRYVWTAMLAGCTLWSARAQDNPLAPTLYPEDLREDLGVIQLTLEQAHPDPYRYRTKAEIDELFSSLSDSFSGPIASEEFIAATLPIFKAVGDANTMLAPPFGLQQSYEHTEPLLPISVAVIGGRLYLNEELKGFRSLPSGCEILQVNDRTAARILAQLRSSLVADGADTTLLDRRIERNFPELYRRFVEKTTRFHIRYRGSDGTTAEKDVFALTKDEMRQSYSPKGYDLAPWRFEELPELHTGWLTLGTMDLAELERRRIDPDRFLNNVREVLRKSGAGTLVVDVRGAGGEDPALAEKVFAIMAQAPYRAVKSMSIRSGRVPDSYQYARPAPEFFASVGNMYLPELNGRRDLKAEDPRLAIIAPNPKAFQGKVYVIGDGSTTGAGAAFVMLADRQGRARTVGEELGSNAASFCGGRILSVTLPRSGCILQVPLTRYVPDGTPGGPLNRGEMPASPVPQLPRDLTKGKDTVRGALLNLIAEMQ